MAKLIVMGDTHGRSFWKQVSHIQEYDKMILLGDYFDSWDISGEDQIRNFMEICAWKREDPDNRILLIGNHDFHYTPTAGMYGDRYSGFQSKLRHQIGHVLATNKDILQVAYSHDQYLFTHAGVTKTWLEFSKFSEGEIEDVAEHINMVYKNRPAKFTFNGLDNSGDDITQGPFWVRPPSLNEDAIEGFTHVVGHTAVRAIPSEPIGLRSGGKCIMIDALAIGRYLIIDNGVIQTGTV